MNLGLNENVSLQAVVQCEYEPKVEKGEHAPLYLFLCLLVFCQRVLRLTPLIKPISFPSSSEPLSSSLPEMLSLLLLTTVFVDLGFAPFLVFVFGAVRAFDLESTGPGGFLGEGGAEAAWCLIVGT